MGCENQTLGNAANFLKKLSGRVNHGVNWTKQRISEPMGDGVRRPSSSGAGLNNEGNSVKRAYDNMEHADRNRSSTGGAINQIRSGKKKRMC